MQHHLNAGGNVVGNERGHANAQVDVLAVAELLRHPSSQFVPCPSPAIGMRRSGAPVFGTDSFGAGSLGAVRIHSYGPACSRTPAAVRGTGLFLMRFSPCGTTTTLWTKIPGRCTCSG